MPRRRGSTHQSRADLDVRVERLLLRWSGDGAFWTADIASAVGQPTPKVRRSLERLERRLQVVRVVKGNPTSWAHK